VENYGLVNFLYSTVADQPGGWEGLGPDLLSFAGVGKGGDAIPSLDIMNTSNFCR
jgi:hypothetical protein